MTNRWTRNDLTALDALLAKFPLAEITAKAKASPSRRNAGRPGYSEEYRVSVFMAIEVARVVGRDPDHPLTIREAAEKVAEAARISWKKPVTVKTLLRLHREQCHWMGLSPKIIAAGPRMALPNVDGSPPQRLCSPVVRPPLDPSVHYVKSPEKK
jgi:hypothetical protein